MSTMTEPEKDKKQGEDISQKKETKKSEMPPAPLRRRPHERTVTMPPIVEFRGIEILNLYASSKEFRKIIDSGNYVFVDNRLVLKSQECISVSNGEIQILVDESALNDYCVKIKRTLIRTMTGGHMRRGNTRCASPFKKRIEYEIEEASKITSINHLNADNMHLFFGAGQEPPDPPHKFSKALIYFMDLKGYTTEKLASETGLSEKTIQRMRTDKTHPDIETVVAICVGLHLGLYYADILLSRAGYILTDSDYHRALYCCVYYAFSCTVEECNYFMMRMGYKPLTDLYDIKKYEASKKLGIGLPGTIKQR